MKLYTTVLKPGFYLRGRKEYTGDIQLKLTADEVRHFESRGLITWSDHPDVQTRLAMEQWTSKRDEVIRAGKSLNYFQRRYKPPCDDDSGIEFIPYGQVTGGERNSESG
jgi:hypothetical protein